MYKLLLYNILLIGIPAMAAAQEYSYVHYGEKEGLAGNIVYDMTIDNKGFIWFATETGVSRFDGTQFKNFSTKDGLPDNEVLKIYADSKGRIWMAPFINKPVVYENRKFTSMGAPGIPDLLLRNNVISFFEHPDKSIFINYQKNFFRYTTDGKLLQWEGVLPVSASDINTYISMETDSLLSFLKQVPPGAFIGEGALKIPGLDNFSIIAVNRNPDGSFVYTRVPNQQVNVAHSFVNDSLYAYNYKDEQVHFYNRHNGELDFIMQFQKFSKCISDEEGNMWISTLGNGVYRIPSIAFKNHTLREASSVYSIVPFEGKVFTGGDYSQVFVTDSIDKTILYGDYRSSLLANGIYKMTFSNNNRVNAMASYKNKYLYACTDGFVIKLEKGKSTYTKGYFSVKSIDVKDDTLLICTGAIALRANAHDLSFIDTIWRSRTTAGVFYNGAYILGTTAGLMEVKPDRTARALATIDKAFERRITNIRRDEEGGLWIGTSGSGVLHYKNGNVLRHITIADGLTSDICTALFVKGNTVWVGTERGLNEIRLNGTNFLITKYAVADGLPSNHVNAVYADNNMVYVGSSQGLTTFDKTKIQEKSQCRLHILQVAIKDSILTNDSAYSFPAGTRNIRVSFIAVSYKSGGGITYYYKLQGLENNWNKTTNTFINYISLPSGNYILQIRAVNKFGVSSDTKMIRLYIATPWWQSWWFIGLVAITVLAGIFFYIRYRTNTIRKKAEEKNQVTRQFAALEQQALQAQMNPHFIFNCLNSIQQFIVLADIPSANKYLTSFAKLVRQTLDNSSKKMLTLEEEIRYLESYLELEKMRFDNRFVYTITVDGDIDKNNSIMPAMLTQPFIENSIRHGMVTARKDFVGNINVAFKKEGNNIVCTVVDNGIGRKQAALQRSAMHIEYQSKGMALTKKRIDLINKTHHAAIQLEIKDLYHEDGSAAGTAVTIIIPQ